MINNVNFTKINVLCYKDIYGYGYQETDSLLRENLEDYRNGLKQLYTFDNMFDYINNHKYFEDGSIILIKNFETNLHFSLFGDTINLIVETCRGLNLQLFLFTQSREVIDTFAEVCHKKDVGMMYFRIGVSRLTKQNIMTSYTIDELNCEKELEIR